MVSPMTRMQTPRKLATATLAALFLFVGSVAALPAIENPLNADANAGPHGGYACLDGATGTSTASGLAGGLPVAVPALPVAAPSTPDVTGAADVCASADQDGAHIDGCAALESSSALAQAEGLKATAMGTAMGAPVPVAVPAAPALPVGTSDLPDVSGADLCGDVSATTEGVDADAQSSVLDNLKGAFMGFFSKIGGLF